MELGFTNHRREFTGTVYLIAGSIARNGARFVGTANSREHPLASRRSRWIPTAKLVSENVAFCVGV